MLLYKSEWNVLTQIWPTNCPFAFAISLSLAQLSRSLYFFKYYILYFSQSLLATSFPFRCFFSNNILTKYKRECEVYCLIRTPHILQQLRSLLAQPYHCGNYVARIYKPAGSILTSTVLSWPVLTYPSDTSRHPYRYPPDNLQAPSRHTQDTNQPSRQFPDAHTAALLLIPF